MTKTFSALAVVLAGLAPAATAQAFPTFGHAFSDFAPLGGPVLSVQDQATGVAEPLGTAQPSTWFYEFHGVDPETIDLLVWASTRPETWGPDAAPYQVAIPGPSYVGLIPAPVPEGWVVTHRCLAWDNTYTSAEAPRGDCYMFEMRSLAVGPVTTP